MVSPQPFHADVHRFREMLPLVLQQLGRQKTGQVSLFLQSQCQGGQWLNRLLQWTINQNRLTLLHKSPGGRQGEFLSVLWKWSPPLSASGLRRDEGRNKRPFG